MRNNRIIRTTVNNEAHYGVAEVYYNDLDDNKPHSRTEFIDGTFSDLEELREHFAMILEDIDKCIALGSILPDLDEVDSAGVRSKKPWYDEDENINLESFKELRQMMQEEE